MQTKSRTSAWRDSASTRQRLTRGGFTLLELLITLGLLLIMVYLASSSKSESFQRKQKQACNGNLQNVFLALSTYSMDQAGRYPSLTNAGSSESPLSLLMPVYTTATLNFICPGAKAKSLPEAEPFADRRISYAYYMGVKERHSPDQPLTSDAQINSKLKATGDLIFSADGKRTGNNHHEYGGNVLFRDGRVHATKPRLTLTVTNTAGVILLNPKPK